MVKLQGAPWLLSPMQKPHKMNRQIQAIISAYINEDINGKTIIRYHFELIII